MVLAVGFFLGGFTTFIVYNQIAKGREAELQARFQQTVRQVERERDEALSRIAGYLEEKRQLQQAWEQGLPAGQPRPGMAGPAESPPAPVPPGGP
jgi:hypothetical protein